jgi:transporter family protein
MSWQLWAVVSAVAAGATAVFAKAGLQGVPSNLGNVIRTAIVLVLSVVILLWSGEHHRWSTLKSRAWIFLTLSAAATAVSWAAYFKALSLGPATPVTAIDKASLVVTLVLSALLLHETPTWRSIVGVLLVVAGAILASLKPGH